MDSGAAKILVVDDDRSLLQTLGVILRDKGYTVVTTSEGRDVARLLDEVRPDLLMLDIMMPKVDGLQLLREVKGSEIWGDLPVLMISSMAPEEATVRSLGLGATDFVPKPFRVKELLARVEAHLRTSRRLHEVRREAQQRADEAAIQSEMVDILHEVTDALAPEDIYNVLTRRVAKVLDLSRCSLVLAKKGDIEGLVVVAAENPMIRNFRIRISRYPEIRRALETNRPVLVTDVQTDPLYEEVRQEWAAEGIEVPIRSVLAIPFGLREEQSGVFFLRTAGEDTTLGEKDRRFAEKVVRTAVSAVERAYALQTAQHDKARYEQLATVDPLTGCLNRRALTGKIDEELERVRRYGLALSALMIDLDHFKAVNDSRGHLAGDSVLRQVGTLLRREVRAVDAVARYGGEEFVVLLPETAQAGAAIFAERIRERIAEHDFGPAGNPLGITVSIGVATVTADQPADHDVLITHADAALYRAKGEGRNLVRT